MHMPEESPILPSEMKLINVDGLQYEDIPEASFFMERLNTNSHLGQCSWSSPLRNITRMTI